MAQLKYPLGELDVASDIGQLSQLVTSDKDGLLYLPGNTDRLADTLLQLYRNPELREKLGRNARETILASHTWEAVGARILQIGESRLDQPNRHPHHRRLNQYVVRSIAA